MDGQALAFRETLDNLLEGFQILDPHWTYLYVNPAAAAHGRTTVAKLTGASMLERYPGIKQTEMFQVLERCMVSRVPQRLENRFEYSDGDARWFELRVEPVPVGIIVCSLDIHDRKLAETALRESLAELERRVEARTRELHELNRELDAFAYSVSHDLRTPLRHIAGFGDALREHAGPSLGDEGLRLLGRITGSAARLGRMIDAVLELARTGRAPVTRMRINLEDGVAHARRDLEPVVASRTIEWRVGPLPEAHADPILLHQVWMNLLSNAMKYTAGRAVARIEVDAVDVTPDEVVIRVRDNGVGFDPAFAGRLFGVFQRLHGAEFEGTGIGLANVRRIVHRHGGRTWAEGAVDAGASFYFTLPAAPA